MDKVSSEKRLSTHQNVPFLIGVGGGTASGKSTVCKKIMEKLGQDVVDNNQRRVVCISQESFYKVLNEADRKAAIKGIYDFDHPNALDNELMLQTLKEILQNKIVRLPVYDFVTHSRKSNEFITVYPADVVLFEGILAFYFREIRQMFDMKLFVDTDPDTRLSKRVIRDVKDRGRDLELVIHQYIHFVKPAFEEFCLPTKKEADVIIPRGADNEVAINLIMRYTESLCKTRRQACKTAQINGSMQSETNSIDRLDRLDGRTDDQLESEPHSGELKAKPHARADSLQDQTANRSTPPVTANCNSAGSKALQALLNNLCYQVTHCDDEKHSTKPNNDLIIIK